MTVEGVYDYLMYVGKISVVTVKTWYCISAVMNINALEFCHTVNFLKIEGTF